MDTQHRRSVIPALRAWTPEAWLLLRLGLSVGIGLVGAALGAVISGGMDSLGFGMAGAPNSPSLGPTGAASPGAAGAGWGSGGGASGGDGSYDDGAGDEGEGIGQDDEDAEPLPGTRSPDDPDYGPLDRALDALLSTLGALPGLSIGLPILQGTPETVKGIKSLREGQVKRQKLLDVVQRERDLRTQFQREGGSQ
jgi:hypothetical protein